MECSCVLALHVTSNYQDVLVRVNASLKYLREKVETGAALDGAAQLCLCRHAWILTTAHEFVDVDALCSLVEGSKPELALSKGSSTLIGRLLSAMCLKGPVAMR